MNISPLYLGDRISTFYFQNSLESSVSFLYAAKLKDLLWLLISFKMWFLLYLYKCSRRMFVHCMWWWLRIQYFQLDSFRLVDKTLSLCSSTFVRLDMVDFDVKLFLLWQLMIDFLFFVQLQLTFTVFLLKILCSLWCRKKYFHNFKK